MKKIINYFTKGEWLLWGVSMVLIISSFLIFSKSGILTLVASVLGVTGIIVNAKGNPLGQAIMVVFSILYAIISYSTAYYGEMITYAGMTGPMALFSFISWIRNPYNGKKSEVRVNRIKPKETVFMLMLTAVVTFIFYYILKYFNTANLIPSTFSITTSFAAVYLTFRRSIYFSAAYAINDIVLIILWGMAAVRDISYLSVLICFLVFLVNDIYGFLSWRKMEKRQSEN